MVNDPKTGGGGKKREGELSAVLTDPHNHQQEQQDDDSCWRWWAALFLMSISHKSSSSNSHAGFPTFWNFRQDYSGWSHEIRFPLVFWVRTDESLPPDHSVTYDGLEYSVVKLTPEILLTLISAWSHNFEGWSTWLETIGAKSHKDMMHT